MTIETVLGYSMLAITIVSMVFCIVAGYLHDKHGNF